MLHYRSLNNPLGTIQISSKFNILKQTLDNSRTLDENKLANAVADIFEYQMQNLLLRLL